MKKTIISGVLCVFVIVLFAYTRCNVKCCTGSVYAQAPKEIYSTEQLQNDITYTDTTHYPQTIVNSLVNDFLQAELAQGKQEKKVLILGFDGFRIDAFLSLLKREDTAIEEVAQTGGLYQTYAGGDMDTRQETSTAPGWASILTGAWSSDTQVYDNEDVLAKEVDTFLIKQARKGIDSAFISSWMPHFEITYQNEQKQAIDEALPIAYIASEDDDDTLRTTLQLLQDPQSIDKADQLDPTIVFSIFEYSDHAGHTSGYGVGNPAYMQACKDADMAGRQLLEAIKQRKNYSQEEWLILITTDHGGNEMGGHGGQSELERATWLASNKAIS